MQEQGRDPLAPALHEPSRVQMSAREQLKARALAAVKRENVTIGDATFRVRGMMLGERNRVMTEAYDAAGKADYNKLYPLVLGQCVEDVETGKQVWNPNSLDDCEEIRALSPVDADALLNVALRLSGMSADSAAPAGKD